MPNTTLIFSHHSVDMVFLTHIRKEIRKVKYPKKVKVLFGKLNEEHQHKTKFRELLVLPSPPLKPYLRTRFSQTIVWIERPLLHWTKRVWLDF